MSLFWLRARCLHTAKSGSDSTRGEKKIHPNPPEKSSWLSGATGQQCLFLFLFFLVLRGMLFPHIKWTRHFIQAIIT